MSATCVDTHSAPGIECKFSASVSAEAPDEREEDSLWAKLVDVTPSIPPLPQENRLLIQIHTPMPAVNTTSLLSWGPNAPASPSPLSLSLCCHTADLQVLLGGGGLKDVGVPIGEVLVCLFAVVVCSPPAPLLRATGTQPVARRRQPPRHGSHSRTPAKSCRRRGSRLSTHPQSAPDPPQILFHVGLRRYGVAADLSIGQVFDETMPLCLCACVRACVRVCVSRAPPAALALQHCAALRAPSVLPSSPG